MLTKQESLQIMQMWNVYGHYLDEVFVRMLKDAEIKLSPKDSEWEYAKQNIEYLAKKQVLIDLKKIISSRYE